MKKGFRLRKRQNAQTLVFFGLVMLTIILLCGLAIDSGLLYLAKAKLGRAVDGAARAAVGNFNRSSVATTNRDSVANIMRNFAAANYTDLESIGTSGSSVAGEPRPAIPRQPAPPPISTPIILTMGHRTPTASINALSRSFSPPGRVGASPAQVATPAVRFIPTSLGLPAIISRT